MTLLLRDACPLPVTSDSFSGVPELQPVLHPKPLYVERVISSICDEFRIRPQQLLSRSRPQWLVTPRHFAMRILYEHFGLSLEEVAKLLGRADHTTVYYAVKHITELCEVEAGLRQQYERVRDRVLTEAGGAR